MAGSAPKDFEGLFADRKGDLANVQGRKGKAISEYQKAYRLYEGKADYRRLVEVKLIALGADPTAAEAVAP